MLYVLPVLSRFFLDNDATGIGKFAQVIDRKGISKLGEVNEGIRHGGGRQCRSGLLSAEVDGWNFCRLKRLAISDGYYLADHPSQI